jgi:hypothetical protein
MRKTLIFSILILFQACSSDSGFKSTALQFCLKNSINESDLLKNIYLFSKINNLKYIDDTEVMARLAKDNQSKEKYNPKIISIFDEKKTYAIGVGSSPLQKYNYYIIFEYKENLKKNKILYDYYNYIKTKYNPIEFDHEKINAKLEIDDCS